MDPQSADGDAEEGRPRSLPTTHSHSSSVMTGTRRVGPVSLKPAWFRQDLLALLDLLQQQKIKPLIAQRLPLIEARQAHELLGKGGVIGKIVLVST